MLDVCCTLTSSVTSTAEPSTATCKDDVRAALLHTCQPIKNTKKDHICSNSGISDHNQDKQMCACAEEATMNFLSDHAHSSREDKSHTFMPV